jgi:hypothetical protein
MITNLQQSAKASSSRKHNMLRRWIDQSNFELFFSRKKKGLELRSTKKKGFNQNLVIQGCPHMKNVRLELISPF